MVFGKTKPQVLVAGAGPVGLFTALSLAKQGIKVEIVDEEWRTTAHSYALMLHPATLKLLAELGVADKVVDKAYPVRSVGLYDERTQRSALNLTALGSDFPFLAVLRQDALEASLEESLRALGVEVHWNHRVARFEDHADHVHVTVEKLEKETIGYGVAHTEWIVDKVTQYDVPFVIAADGHRSIIRRQLDIDFDAVGDPAHFAVFEFRTDADLAHEMRLVLAENTTNVCWPLPQNYCRWSFQLADTEVPQDSRVKDRTAVQVGSQLFPMLTEERLRALLAERAPWFKGSVGEIDWRMAVRFERRIARSFGKGRLWLAGDAGHMTGPVGGQSMNVGMREGYDLAGIVGNVLRGSESLKRLERYNTERLAEWNFLLGLKGGLVAQPGCDPWISARAQRLLPCITETGADLARLAAQIGLKA